MRKLTTLTACVASVVLAATAAACSSSSSGQSSSASKTSSSAPLRSEVPAQYKKGFTVGVQVDEVPLSYENSSGQIVGVNPDLIRYIQALIGTPINVVQTSFENELTGVNEKRYGFVTNTNVTAPREKIYDQVSFYQDAYTIGSLKSNPTIGTSLLDLCGLALSDDVGDEAIAYLQGVSKQCVSAGKKAITILQLPTITEAYLAVNSGRADGTINTRSIYGYYITTPPGKTWRMTGPNFLPIYVGFTFPKGSGLAPVIAKAINMLIKNGTYKKVMDENDLGGNLVSTALVNPKPLG